MGEEMCWWWCCGVEWSGKVVEWGGSNEIVVKF